VPLEGGFCDHCEAGLQGAGRGKRQRFCQPACRRAYWREAAKAGDRTIRRRQLRAARPPARARQDPKARLRLASELLLGLTMAETLGLGSVPGTGAAREGGLPTP